MQLKSLGFDDICDNMYDMGVFHHDEYIDFDEEHELIDAGKKDEIQYISGGRIYNHMQSRNSDLLVNEDACTMPSYEQALEYMRVAHDIHIFIMRKNGSWHWCVQDMRGNDEFLVSNNGYTDYGTTLDTGISEIAKKIKEQK